jgi:hypothetical protein
MRNGQPSPAPLRTFPGMRWVRITLRTAHLIAMGLLVGGVAVGTPIGQLNPAAWGTLLSGALFVCLELYESWIFLVQVKGLAVLLKLLLLAGAMTFPGSALPLLVAAIVIGGFSSHMPGKYRYYSIMHGRALKGSSG